MERSRITLATLAGSALLFASLLATHGESRAQQAPANDDFERYTLIGISSALGSYADTISTAGATLEQGEPTCTADGGATVWYVFYPNVSGEFVVDTAGSDFATTVAVYHITDFAPSPPGGSLEELVCTGGPTPSRVEFTARSGEGGYAIQIGGFGGETGTLQLTVACERGCAPPNDLVVGPTYLYEVPFEETLRTSDATVDEGEPLPCGDIGSTVWYRIEVSERAGDLLRVGASADYTPVLALYTQSTRSFSPPGALDLLTCNVGDPGSQAASLEFTTEPFTTYYIQAGGASGAGGLLTITMSCAEGVCRFIDDAPTPIQQGGGAADGDTEIAPGVGGVVTLPSTGSGGYLPQE